MGSGWRARFQEAFGRRGENGPSSDASAGDRAQRTLLTQEVSLDDISANPYQPRQTLDVRGLEDLADSIAQHGVLQPIIVRPVGSAFELVAGQRRVQAARLAGLRTVPAVIIGVDDEDSGVLALVENLQREDLGFLEEASALERLVTEFGLTQVDLARRLGKSQSTIANKLRLLRLAPEVLSRLTAGGFSERHARALLALREAHLQLRVLDEIRAKELTVRQTEALVERLVADLLAAGAANKSKPAQSWRVVFRDARIISNTFKAAVERLEQSGMQADFEEIEREDGLEIRVLVHLPVGWRDGTSGREGATKAGHGKR